MGPTLDGSGFSAPQDWSEGIPFYGSAGGPAPPATKLVSEPNDADDGNLARPPTYVPIPEGVGCLFLLSRPKRARQLGADFAAARLFYRCKASANAALISVKWVLRRYRPKDDDGFPWEVRAYEHLTHVGPAVQLRGPYVIKAPCANINYYSYWVVKAVASVLYVTPSGLASSSDTYEQGRIIRCN